MRLRRGTAVLLRALPVPGRRHRRALTRACHRRSLCRFSKVRGRKSEQRLKSGTAVRCFTWCSKLSQNVTIIAKSAVFESPACNGLADC